MTVTAVSSTGLDVRSDFPILAREIDGRPLVYLDSASTSQKPEQVLAALDDFYRNHNANIHRGVYPLAQEADALFEGARARIAAFVNWPVAATIFTRNVTEAINLVAYSWGRTNLRAGKAVLLTQMEHHSNIVPWQLATQATGATLRYLDVDADGKLSLDQLDAELARGDVALVALAHVSNVLGTINPVAEIARRAHAAGAVVVVDGAQAVPQLPIWLPDLDVDFYAWTGHKAYGPTGIGVLHGRRELLEEMPPFIGGGHMIRTVSANESTWMDLPGKFEAGTSQIAEAIGLGAAVDWIRAVGIERIHAHEQALVGELLERLSSSEVPGLTIQGPASAADRGALVSFTLEGAHPHDIADILGNVGVCVRAGHHCAQPLMRCLGVPATTRASFAVHNTSADIDRLIEGLGRVRATLRLD